MENLNVNFSERAKNERRLAIAGAGGKPSPAKPFASAPAIPHRPAQVRENILDKPFASFGEQLIAIRDNAIGQTMGRPIDPRLLQIRAASGASESVPSDGGFMIAPQFSEQIWTRVYSQGQLLSRFAYLPLSPNSRHNGVKIPAFDEQSRADGSRWGGVKSYWINEAATITASKPKYRNIELLLKKLVGLCYATDELMSDSAALGAAMQIAFANELTFKIEYASLFGTGSGQPAGMLSANPALITVAKDASQASGTITASNLVNVFTRMFGPSRRNAVWVISESVDSALINDSIVVKNVAGTENVGGFRLYKPAESDDDFPRILGRPVLVVEGMPTIGNLGDIALIDPSQYIYADQGGMDFTTSAHVNFISDESVFRIVWRIDGQPMWNSTLTPFGGGNPLSAYVTLGAR